MSIEMEKAQEVFETAIQAEEAGGWNEAIRVGRQITKRQPRAHQAYSVIARGYAELGRWKMAERFYRRRVGRVVGRAGQ